MTVDYIPFVTPRQILKFFNQFPLIQFAKANPKIGESVVVTNASIWDYFKTIPEKYRDRPPYASEYNNALLKMMQLLVNEGLLTPEGNAAGFDQRYRGNGFSHANLIDYGYYDFMIFGFPFIRKNFEDTVRPIILNQGSQSKTEGIGTGFTVEYNRVFYFVTARHCLPKGDLVTISPFVSDKPLIPVNVFVPLNHSVDIAVIEVSDKIIISDKWFKIGQPHILDEVLTMGYPPIPGFTEAIQVAEIARISSGLKSTTGLITGQGIHYHGGMMEHFLISARVKGGNSGGPVINKNGLVVGIVIESPEDGNSSDALGYGIAVSSLVLKDLFAAIHSESNSIEFTKLSFEANDSGFVIT